MNFFRKSWPYFEIVDLFRDCWPFSKLLTFFKIINLLKLFNFSILFTFFIFSKVFWLFQFFDFNKYKTFLFIKSQILRVFFETCIFHKPWTFLKLDLYNFVLSLNIMAILKTWWTFVWKKWTILKSSKIFNNHRWFSKK